MAQKTALITGITGQDGAVLAQILLEKNYHVHGMRPYSAVPDTARVEGLDITLHYGDVTDGGAILRLLETIKPDEIYNLAGMSHVHVSFDMPELTANVNGLGPIRILEAMRLMHAQKEIRFYQASSSEMFGRAPAPQSEQTPFEPCSPYGASKLYAYWMVRQYREAYGLHASNGILFNHESALRGEEFVTRKITKAIGQIEAGLRNRVSLGNLDAKRDWGHAHDYMHGAWAMLQQKTPDDYVLATGQSYSVRDFLAKAFAVIGVNIIWKGAGLNELGINKQTGQTIIDIDPALFRPTEIHNLIGDASKAKHLLNWTPRHSFDDLVTEMVQADRIVQNAAPMKYGT
ncbi:MAG: GDP-mannose 4,6-dehydratase [Alphaproteobacteria bacterium]|nr:GDP-mannose 4,6-dehydratase [Alphaproteobacteria bacterium]NCQ88754.1 GDP-mannose 4,6-dehydratase [Alphaproteobacteria bacterium]NCT07323.1 GDP-mannose 4,6-dehydratase [Alphaproteobacteria bacterium]